MFMVVVLWLAGRVGGWVGDCGDADRRMYKASAIVVLLFFLSFCENYVGVVAARSSAKTMMRRAKKGGVRSGSSTTK
jgi:hypothetical protein